MYFDFFFEYIVIKNKKKKVQMVRFSFVFFLVFVGVGWWLGGGGGGGWSAAALASRLTASNCAIISEKEGNLSLISSLGFVPKKFEDFLILLDL